MAGGNVYMHARVHMGGGEENKIGKEGRREGGRMDRQTDGQTNRQLKRHLEVYMARFQHW